MTRKHDLAALQKKIGVVFREPEILERALTHRSYINEAPRGTQHNELLEFFGDAALEWVVTQHLVRNYGHEEEGILTNIRAKTVAGATLAEVAERLHLGEYLRVSRGGVRDLAEPHSRSRILCNTLEAVIGAIALDRGLGTAELFIVEFLLPICEEVIRQRAYHDPKSYLQELFQEKLHLTPRYETLRSSGPDHAKEFTVACYAGDRLLSRGRGGNKLEAEIAAARGALRDEFRVELPELEDVLSRTADKP